LQRLGARLVAFFRPSRMPGGARSTGDLTCREVRELASDYLEQSQGRRALDETLLEKVQRHLQACRPCVSFMNTLKRTVDLLAGLPPAEAPPDVRQRILDQASRR